MAEDENKIWKKFFTKHWKMFALFVAIAILAFIGAIYVFLWLVEDAQITNLVPMILGDWTIAYCITFFLHLIFWEFIYIGIPVMVALVLAYLLWWKKLPVAERKEYRRGNLFGKKSRRRDGGGAISFLVNVFFVIKVYLDGNLDLAFKDWEFDYLVYSYLTALIWVLVVFGIPITIGLIVWISNRIKKNN